MEEYVSSANKARDTEASHPVREHGEYSPSVINGALGLDEVTSRSLLSDAHLGGRGNSSVRAASMQNMQKTNGNRAVQRFMSQQATPTASELPSIQRWPDLGGLLETITQDVDWRTGPTNPGAFPSFPKEVNEYAEPRGNIESSMKEHLDLTRQVRDTPGYSGYDSGTSYGGGGNDYGYGNMPPSYTPPSYKPPTKPPSYKPPVKPPSYKPPVKPPAPPSYTPPSYTPPSYSSEPSYDYGNEQYEESEDYEYTDVTSDYGDEPSYSGGGYDNVPPRYTPPNYTPPIKPPSYTPPVKPPPPAPPSYTPPSYTPTKPPTYTPPTKPPSYTPPPSYGTGPSYGSGGGGGYGKVTPPSYSSTPSYNYSNEQSYSGGGGHEYEQSVIPPQYSSEPSYNYGSAPSDSGFGVGYDEDDSLRGLQGKFSALHDERSIFGIPTTFDALTAEGKIGEFEESNPDGSTETRSGVSVSGGVGKTTFNKDGLISGDVGAGTFGADANIGSNGATLGATANLGEASITGGNFSNKSNTDESIRVGLSKGVGLAGRLHWGDSDHDGHREFGAGVDAGIFSMDVKTEDPMRTLMGMPGIGPLNPFAKAGIDAKDMLFPEQKSNMTEDLLGAVSGSDKPVTTGTVWDRAINMFD